MTTNPASLNLGTSRRVLAQLIFCKGCCCGQVERGFPELPLERLKSAWKMAKLNRIIQLTISGCVGPCDLANVAVVVTAAGTEWYGKLSGDAIYDDLIAWASDCHASQSLRPLPAALHGHRFERFMPVS